MNLPSDCMILFVSILLIFSVETQQLRANDHGLNNANTGFSSRINNEAKGKRWAVLIAGSNGYGNYRHQADVCHAYQTLKKGGLKDENIVVMMYDDVAFNPENPRPGIIINNPDGDDVYQGVPKDYTGKYVNVNNFYAVVLGNKSALTGGSGKVIESGPDDHIFIYYADHGAPGILGMPTDEDLVAVDFIKVLKKKHKLGTYKKMVIYVEACESGSIFQGLLPSDLNIYAVTAANAEESSWGTYCPGDYPSPPSEYDTCLGDVFSISWLEDSDMHDTSKETLEQQYQVVRRRTAVDNVEERSHVMHYGTTNLQKDFLFSYIGTNPSNENFSVTRLRVPPRSRTRFIEQRDVDLLYLQRRLRKASKGSRERVEAQKKLQEELNHRKHVDQSIKKFSELLVGVNNVTNVFKSTRPSGQPLVDDWDCFKTLVASFKKSCEASTSYGMKYGRAFAYMCNIMGAVKTRQMVSVIQQVCSKENDHS